ncbi:TadE/TadG family type IV pilus assembly protein [Zobellella aerophila]|uniref:Pilus assembly protein n=1 Tax=Zobellella aerophila TaxID=870480 RepID=A0ABP6VFF5_9GAMM
MKKCSRSWAGYNTHRQQGTTTVEFAIVGAVVFLVLFAVMEVGRLMYTWGLLNEVSRRAARLATVCRVQEVQDGTVASAVVNQLAGSMPGFVPTNLAFAYLDQTASTLADPAGTDFDNIRYVRSQIVNYQYQMILPLTIDLSMLAPDFSSTLRAESLGQTRQGDAICDDTGGVSL